MTNHQFAVRIKPGERSMVGGVSYLALIPHSILEADYLKGSQRFLVEYPEKEVLRKEWVSIKDLEERGFIKLIENPSLKFFVAMLETLADQGFIDVGPTEGDYDATPIYDFLVVGGFAERVAEEKYWLRLINQDSCEMLAGLLKSSQPDLFEEAED